MEDERWIQLRDEIKMALFLESVLSKWASRQSQREEEREEKKEETTPS
jgi:hypothetical protein